MRDHEIIELYWARNESAITATAEKYGSYCHTIAYNILHSKEDAEECANDTYLGAWNSIPPQRPNRLSIYLRLNHKVIFDYLFKSSYMPV